MGPVEVMRQGSEGMGDGRARMLFAGEDGKIYDHPELELLGWDGQFWRPLEDDELMPLPKGSDLFLLPGRRPAGLDRAADEVVVYDPDGPHSARGHHGVGGAVAVAAFLAPAYLRTLYPAYETQDGAPTLPLFAYSAVGLRGDEFVVPAVRVDPDIRQDPYRFDLGAIDTGVDVLRGRYPENRLVEHLTHCAQVYHCRAAQNYFLERFEAPLPTARGCNARCIGCISLQAKPGEGPGEGSAEEADFVEAPHERIDFNPTPAEIAEVALGHIERVGEDAVVSFGQGCEGEPLMRGHDLVEAIERIRAVTPVGVINLNSNASRPPVVAAMAAAGLDSMRISTNSAQPAVYDAYYRPHGYTFDDVRASARAVRDAGGYLMLNYLVFPGVTDTQAELDALSAWIDEVGIDMLQLRNLNVDPEVYLRAIRAALEAAGGLGEPLGMVPWLRALRDRHPGLRLGYFNPPRRLFREPPPRLDLPAT